MRPCTPSRPKCTCRSSRKCPRRRSSNPPGTFRSSTRTSSRDGKTFQTRRCGKPPCTCPSTCTCRWSCSPAHRQRCRTPAGTNRPSTCSAPSGSVRPCRRPCRRPGSGSRAPGSSTGPPRTSRPGHNGRTFPQHGRPACTTLRKRPNTGSSRSTPSHTRRRRGSTGKTGNSRPAPHKSLPPRASSRRPPASMVGSRPHRRCRAARAATLCLRKLRPPPIATSTLTWRRRNPDFWGCSPSRPE
mmetsp:Transcript_79391/g.202222  ORF Transcript_79391/g.202222 Transcript_79391/m.202222 type:complete len:242 (+) Transcript_79391:1468-2193(+)